MTRHRYTPQQKPVARRKPVSRHSAYPISAVVFAVVLMLGSTTVVHASAQLSQVDQTQQSFRPPKPRVSGNSSSSSGSSSSSSSSGSSSSQSSNSGYTGGSQSCVTSSTTGQGACSSGNGYSQGTRYNRAYPQSEPHAPPVPTRRPRSYR